MTSLKRVIAVCFPRSGSYFLTHCMSRYFADRLKYLEPYSNTSILPLPRFDNRFWGARILNSIYFSNRRKHNKEFNQHVYSFSEANFIRFHDFSSFSQRAIYMSEEGVNIEREYSLDNVANQDNTSYLILIRHPLEAIQSYYELLVRRSGLSDSHESWVIFREHALEYWMNFADKWILNANDSLIENKTVVLYEDLIKNTMVALSRAVCCFSHKELKQRQVKEIAKLRYSSTRKISDFKYFDADYCERMQDELHESYLRPMGIVPHADF